MKCDLSDIRHSWVVIFMILLFFSPTDEMSAQVASVDTVYNQSYDWVAGHREALPEWVFAPRQQDRVIGVSDPCMNPEAARIQALQRAVYLYSLQQGVHLNLLSDVFSSTDTAVNTYEDERNKILTLGVIEQTVRREAYRIEEEYTSAYGEKFIQVSFMQADSCDLSYHSVSELMFLFTKERVEEEEIKFNLLLESGNCPKESFQSRFQMKVTLVSPCILSCMNGVPIRPSQKGYWYEDTLCAKSRESVDGIELKSGFWTAYMASFVKSLLLYPFSNVDVRRVSDEFNGGNKSSRALYREKIVTFLSISPFVKEIRNNRLCMDWQITEQQKINEK